ncbi:hypothetical protein [Oryzomonas sagensis]|uniref:hypothetical protein n=1 Tax=Oryzomonas sagensis TaxID=2603857 RepID=UPI00178684D5|nr:hypothetical protein [Oryzomonas sagensis]
MGVFIRQLSSKQQKTAARRLNGTAIARLSARQRPAAIAQKGISSGWRRSMEGGQ